MSTQSKSVSRSNRTKTALALMIVPTILIIASFALYAILNWAFSYSTVEPMDNGTGLFQGSSPRAGNSMVNIVLFLFGVLGVIAWLPGLIVGIVLLATRKK